MIRYQVMIDEGFRSALPALQDAAGVTFSKDEVQRVFADHDSRQRKASRYVLYRCDGMSLAGVVEEIDPNSIWVTVRAAQEIEANCERVLLGLRVLAVAGENQRRPAFRFGLKSMFVALTVLAVPLCWACVQWQWIRARHETMERLTKDPRYKVGAPAFWFVANPSAPWSIAIFGEKGFSAITLPADSEYGVADIQALFPEAHVYRMRFSDDDRYYFF